MLDRCVDGLRTQGPTDHSPPPFRPNSKLPPIESLSNLPHRPSLTPGSPLCHPLRPPPHPAFTDRSCATALTARPAGRERGRGRNSPGIRGAGGAAASRVSWEGAGISCGLCGKQEFDQRWDIGHGWA
jgi:hypothetical protein